MTTKRGFPRLQYNGYSFGFKRGKEGGEITTWMCTKKTKKKRRCNATVDTKYPVHLCPAESIRIGRLNFIVDVFREKAELTNIGRSELIRLGISSALTEHSASLLKPFVRLTLSLRLAGQLFFRPTASSTILMKSLYSIQIKKPNKFHNV